MAVLQSPKRPGPVAPAKKAVATVQKATGADAVAQRLKTRKEGLIGLAQIGAFLCTVRGQFANVGTINEYADETCHELAAVGEENEMIGRGLDMLASAGPYTKLFTVALPFTLQMMANSGRIDWKLVQNLGVTDPQIVASKAIADLQKMAAEAERRAQEEQQQAAQQQMRMREPNGQQHSAHTAAG